ncbi:DNA-binding transcriptional regulator GbsR (MarR family) [Salisediminibacterium halotolerans]|nr:DNA-binding transcriptional regulator GbsR (MarR family) [Actinophytocola xinjiangensis]RPE89789.1 DNA-binding transcriptional regulator GbsR (MarR family) [Salisediminibacterium halotolerans]TWG32625.1 DNA-binding transcriptional regulator GbsR (MarR family) [Salisediminibacterium halotolerans]GEL07563.1 HTH-type transcriptional repressor GbsR [Salisediminibacterium halotolerans]
MAEFLDEDAKQSIDNAKDLVVDSLAETMDLYGVTRSAGTLYGTMYFEGDMTLDEMRDQLGMSKPSMSTGVKKLQDFNVVKKTFRKGQRKHTYVAERDFFRFFANFFSYKWEREVDMNLEAIRTAQNQLADIIASENLSAEVIQEAQETYDILEQSKPYYYWLQRLAAMVKSGEIFDIIPFYPMNEEEDYGTGEQR